MRLVEDSYPEMISMRGITMFDGAPTVLEHQDRVHVYFGAFREYPWNPDTLFGYSSGTYLVRMNRGRTLSSPTYVIEQGLQRDQDHRPKQVLRPMAYENKGDYDTLQHISFAFRLGPEDKLGLKTPKVFGLTQVENALNWGQWNGFTFPSNTPTYGMGGLVVSSDAVNFSMMRTEYYNESRLQPEEWERFGPLGTPILTHWQTKQQIMAPQATHQGVVYPATQTPAGLRGVVVSAGVIINKYLYIFYTRQPDLRNHLYDPQYREWYGFSPYPSIVPRPEMYEPGFVEKRKLYLKGNVCLARISLEDLVHPDYVNRGVQVKKYFNGEFGEPGIGGWDTAILNPPASYPHVCFSTFLNRYVMVAQEFTAEEQLLKWYVSANEGKSEEALLQWDYMGVLEQSKPKAFYPRLVNEEGTDSREIGKDAWLFYCSSVPGFLGQINPRMFRRKITFEL